MLNHSICIGILIALTSLGKDQAQMLCKTLNNIQEKRNIHSDNNWGNNKQNKCETERQAKQGVKQNV